jgi:hypothetical protein
MHQFKLNLTNSYGYNIMLLNVNVTDPPQLFTVPTTLSVPPQFAGDLTPLTLTVGDHTIYSLPQIVGDDVTV